MANFRYTELTAILEFRRKPGADSEPQTMTYIQRDYNEMKNTAVLSSNLVGTAHRQLQRAVQCGHGICRLLLRLEGHEAAALGGARDLVWKQVGLLDLHHQSKASRQVSVNKGSLRQWNLQQHHPGQNLV